MKNRLGVAFRLATALLPITIITLCTAVPALAQSPVSLRTIIEVAGTDSGSALGFYAKGVGDLNKDGFADVAVSAPHLHRTFIYYGGNPMSTKPALVLQGGGTIVSGDFNGDGWRDLAIEKWFEGMVFVYYGGNAGMDTMPDVILHPETPGEFLGYEAMAAGDLNSDGFDDLILGAQNGSAPDLADGQNGKVYFFAGGHNIDTIPKAVMIGDSADFHLGMSVAIGARNLDSTRTVSITGYNTASHFGNTFYYYLDVYHFDRNFHGTRTMRIDSHHVPGGFGKHVTSFDADGDGIEDILVDGIDIFKGGPVIDTLPTYLVRPPSVFQDTTTHIWVGGGGDYNRDGVKDVLMSPPAYIVLVYLGGEGLKHSDVAFKRGDAIDGFAGAMDNAGDVNGDGVDDIIIGAPAYGFPDIYGFFGIYSGDTSLVVSVNGSHIGTVPTEVTLRQNYPNPFNPSTTIEYTLIRRSDVTLRIYDALGREVWHMAAGIEDAGAHRVEWGGKDGASKTLSSGIYYYQLQTDESFQAKTMIYLK